MKKILFASSAALLITACSPTEPSSTESQETLVVNNSEFSITGDLEFFADLERYPSPVSQIGNDLYALSFSTDFSFSGTTASVFKWTAPPADQVEATLKELFSVSVDSGKIADNVTAWSNEEDTAAVLIPSTPPFDWSWSSGDGLCPPSTPFCSLFVNTDSPEEVADTWISHLQTLTEGLYETTEVEVSSLEDGTFYIVIRPILDGVGLPWTSTLRLSDTLTPTFVSAAFGGLVRVDSSVKLLTPAVTLAGLEEFWNYSVAVQKELIATSPSSLPVEGKNVFFDSVDITWQIVQNTESGELWITPAYSYSSSDNPDIRFNLPALPAPILDGTALVIDTITGSV